VSARRGNNIVKKNKARKKNPAIKVSEEKEGKEARRSGHVEGKGRAGRGGWYERSNKTGQSRKKRFECNP